MYVLGYDVLNMTVQQSSVKHTCYDDSSNLPCNIGKSTTFDILLHAHYSRFSRTECGQIFCKLCVNILNKQSRTVDKWQPCSIELVLVAKSLKMYVKSQCATKVAETFGLRRILLKDKYRVRSRSLFNI